MVEWRRNLKIEKDPDSILDYVWDFTDWLPLGDTIVSHLVKTDDGITVVASSNDDTKVTVWLSGGSANVQYTVTVQITTASTPARVVERSIIFRVREQ